MREDLRVRSLPLSYGDYGKSTNVMCMRVRERSKSVLLTGKALTNSSDDVDGIKVVINYDYPQQTEDYVHRIGRTGRSNATGEAYTFFTFAERKMAKELISILEEAHQTVPPELLKWRNMFGGGGNNRFNRFGTFRGGRDFGGGGYGGGGNRFGGGGGGGDYRNGGSSMGAKRTYDSSNGGYGASSSNSYSNSYGAASSSTNGGGYESRGSKHTRFD